MGTRVTRSDYFAVVMYAQKISHATGKSPLIVLLDLWELGLQSPEGEGIVRIAEREYSKILAELLVDLRENVV